jgi:hypothetical protein
MVITGRKHEEKRDDGSRFQTWTVMRIVLVNLLGKLG